MTKITFKPIIRTLGTFNSCGTLKDETMFFSSSPKFIEENKKLATITYDLLLYVMKSLNGDENLIIDTRVTMLMRGQYPSIPGWHCDAVPRGGSGQPDFSQCSDSVQHYMCLLTDSEDSVISGTKFVTNERSYEIDKNQVWNSLNSQVEADDGKQVRSVQVGEVIRFNQLAIHTATPATSNGWRLFFRASAIDGKEPANEIRRQTQVYVDPANAGW